MTKPIIEMAREVRPDLKDLNDSQIVELWRYCRRNGISFKTIRERRATVRAIR